MTAKNMMKRRTKMMNDTARCRDKKCPSHKKCLRYSDSDEERIFMYFAYFERSPAAVRCSSFILRGKDYDKK